MINRSQPLYILRLRTLGEATALSFAIFALLPLVAAICVVAGWIAFLACWVPVVVMAVLSWGLLIGGGIAVIGGMGEKNPALTGGGIAAAIPGAYLCMLFSDWYKPCIDAANASVMACSNAGWFVFSDVFLGFYVHVWSWGVIGSALVAFGAVWLTIFALWLEAPLKYSLLKIGYACPDCHKRREPFFRCSKCSSLIKDLKPSRYGVFLAKCGSCGDQLPTLDLNGRLRLAKVCSNSGCSQDLKDDALGNQSEYHIAVVGAASSGKTNLMVMAIHQLEQAFAPANQLSLAFANQREERTYRLWIKGFQSGRVMGKTGVAPTPKAFNLSIQPTQGMGSLLYLYDAAGEDFLSEDSLQSHSFQNYVDGVLFVVDPLAETTVRSAVSDPRLTAELTQSNPAVVEASSIMARLVSSLERALRIGAGKRFPVPLAIAVTKVDACGLEAELGGIRDITRQYATMAEAVREAEAYTDSPRRFLERAGLQSFLRIADSRFSRVACFAVSALGRVPNPNDNSPFRPRGSVTPLVWLMCRIGALSDGSNFQRIVQNAWVSYVCAMRGGDSVQARSIAWSLTVGAAAVGICGVWFGSLILFGGMSN